MGGKEIAKTLNREGFHAPTGKRWGKTTVHKILTNEAYCGTLVFGDRPSHPVIHSGEPPVRVENAWPAMIDKDTFYQVQKVMSENAPKAIHPRIVPGFYLLSGILFCSCGSAMVGRSAKSHRYYYYTCNRSLKQGREICGSRTLPKGKIELLVIKKIKTKILDNQILEELVRLVNADLAVGYSLFKEKIANIDINLQEVENRLSRLYDALETSKLTLDDLSPRIKELRAKQEELGKARIIAEAEMAVQDYQQLDIDTVRSNVMDLRKLLGESEVAQRKAFSKSFIKKIVVDKDIVKLYYHVPVPPDGKRMETVGVLPIDTPSGPKVTFAKPIESFFELSIGTCLSLRGTIMARNQTQTANARQQGIKSYLEPEEVIRLSQAATKLRDLLLILLLFRLGCRILEALALEVQDIDLIRGLATIQHLKTRLKLSCPNCSTPLGRSHSYCPKCGIKVEQAVAEAKEHRRLRTLPMDKNTLQMLQEYIQQGGAVKREGKTLIFGINRHRAWQIIRECAERAGLPQLINPETGKVNGVSPHKLRDAFAVHAMKVDDSGEGMRLLQEHLGHASFNTTAKYRKITSEEHKAWYEKLW